MVDFVQHMLQKDVASCEILVKQLIAQLPEDNPGWEEALGSIVKGVALHYHHECLLIILQHLPLRINERLFSTLLQTQPVPPCFKTLVQYLNGILIEKKQEAQVLTTMVLSSNLAVDEQQGMINDILEKNSSYDWDNRLFLEALYPKLTLMLLRLPLEALNKNLKIIKNLALKHSKVSDKQAVLLDAIYAATKNTAVIADSLAGEDNEVHLIIDFITRSKSNDAALREACLKKISSTQLARFAAHMLALNLETPGIFANYITVICHHLKSQPKPQQLYDDLAGALSVLPPQEKELAIKNVLEHLSTAEQKHWWLLALLLRSDNKMELVPYCIGFIKQFPEKTSLLVLLGKEFSNEQLLELYLQMITQGLDIKHYSFLKELFKAPEKQAVLTYILNETPAVNPHLLKEFLQALDDESLLQLLAELLSTCDKKSNFKSTLNQVLLVFCQRLYEKPNTATIHQWQQKTFAKSLCESLLDNPECVYNLSTYSLLTTWTTWSTAEAALKPRIDAVLNCTRLQPSQCTQIALSWLEYFRAKPENLYTVFTNLKSSLANRTPVGNNNLTEIKKACWNLIKPGAAFNEVEFLTILHAGKPELFDPLVQHLAREKCLQQDPHHGSIWLAKTKGDYPLDINTDWLIPILLHSCTSDTAANWTKTADWLERCAPERRLELVTKLISQISSANNNPVLIHYTHQLIISSKHFNMFFSQLNEAAWLWLFKYADPKYLTLHASQWVELMTNGRELTKINTGKILATLPKETNLIHSILEKIIRKEPAIINPLFIQLCAESEQSIAMNGLYEIIKKLPNDQILLFLKSVVSQLKPEHINPASLELLGAFISTHYKLLGNEFTHNESFQKVLFSLLLAGKNIDKEAFTSLWQLLSATNKNKLASQILEQERLVDGQEQCITLIANALYLKDIMRLHNSKAHAVHLTTALLTHSQGLSVLSAVERKAVFDSIKGSAQLLALLNSDTCLALRLSMVNELFETYGPDLANKLHEWSITGEGIAALANYTIDKPRQDLLIKIIDQTGSYQSSLNTLLLNPNFKLTLNKDSLLYQIAYTLLNTISSKPCNVSLIGQLSLSDGLCTLEHQLIINQKLQHFTTLFKPLAANENNASYQLLAARWHSRLVLLRALFAVIHFYDAKPSITPGVIEKTGLYKEIILPLRTNPLKPDLDNTLLNNLYPYLKSYCTDLGQGNVTHVKEIQTMLADYEQQLLVLEHGSAPQLYDYFKPESVSTPSESLIIKVATQHQNWIKEHHIEPDIRFKLMLEEYLQQHLAFLSPEQHQKIFKTFLFSSLSKNLEPTVLKSYLGQIDPNLLMDLIDSFSKKAKPLRIIIKELNFFQPLLAVVKQLSDNSLEFIEEYINAADALELIIFREIGYLAKQIKYHDLSDDAIAPIFLKLSYEYELGTQYLQHEFSLIQERLGLVSTRLNQLLQLGLSAHNDANDELRLAQLKTPAHAPLISPSLVAYCLPTYGASLGTRNTIQKEFFSIMKSIMANDNTETLIKNFDPQVIKHIIEAAVQNPAASAEVLEQLIQSTSKEQVLAALKAALVTLLKQGKNPEVTTISQLSAEQLGGLSKESLDKALSLQRLIYLATPPLELNAFIAAAENTEQQRKRRLLIADASLYMTLADVDKEGKANRDKYTNWVMHHCQNHYKDYAEELQLVSDKELQFPKARYYALCLKTFISNPTNNSNTLADGLMDWLKVLNVNQLKTPELQLLLQQVIEHKQLTSVFKKCVMKHWELSGPQIAWLCENSLRIAPRDTSNLPSIIKLSSWSWLESYMKHHGPLEFELLEIALGKEEYLKSINENEESQLHFINRLKSSNYILNQLLSLVGKTKDNQVRTLVIIHIFTRKDILSTLKGGSILDRLTDNELHTPSRLNPLTHQIELKTLTPKMIAMLEPEAAVSLICSVPHFQIHTSELIEALLGVYPKGTVASYWVSHYALMPGAAHTLAHLFKSADSHILPLLQTMEESKKEAIMGKIIEHLPLFNPIPKILTDENEEKRLIIALRLVNNGHKDKSYVNLITRLMEKLLSKNHPFSLEAIQLIIALNGKDEFSELNNKTAYLTNHYLRAKAQKGDVSLFYEAEQINTVAMSQTVQLKAPLPNQPSIAKETIDSLLGKKSVVPNVQAATANIPESDLVNELKSNKRQVTAFDYFLMHFKGNVVPIKHALNDLMKHHVTNSADTRKQTLEQLCLLITKKEIELPIKEAIYSSLLLHPELFNEHISYCLFVFDAKRTVQHFGLKGGETNYRRVISLCNWALKKLDSSQNSTAITVAKQAQSEAQLELTFHEERGFFARLFRRLKRCWISGWTGFFSPNLPIYVLPASTKKSASEAKIAADTNKKTTNSKATDLLILIKECKGAITIEKLDDIISALKTVSLQFKPRNEIETRASFHELHKQLLADCATNTNWNAWLNKNQDALVDNTLRLIELTISKGNTSELTELIKGISKDTPKLNKVIAEFSCDQPEQKPVTITEKPAVTEEEPDLIKASAKAATTMWNWASQQLTGFFPNPSDTTTPQSAAPPIANP